MNSEIIMQGFQQYLIDKNISEGNENNIQTGNNNLVSVFSNQNEFRKYLVEQMGASSAIMDMDIGEILEKCYAGEDLEGLSENELYKGAEQISEGNSETKNNNSNSNGLKNYNLNFITDIYKDFTPDELNILGTLFDSDGDGTLTAADEANAKNFLGVIGNQNGAFGSETLGLLKNYIAALKNSGMNAEDIVKNIKGLDGKVDDTSINDFIALKSIIEASNMGIMPNTAMEEAGAGEEPSDSSEFSGPSVKSPANTEKNFENMSIEDLKEELNNAEAKYDESFNDYVDEVDKVDKELAGNIRNTNEEISTKENELSTANAALNENKQIYTDTNNSINEATTRSGEIDGEIAALQKSKDEKDENGEPIHADTSAIDSQISALEEEKRIIEEETLPELNKKLEAAQEKINELEQKTIPALEKGITDLQIKLQGYEQDSLNIAKSNPQIQVMLDSYKEAEQYKNNVKQTLDIRMADKAREEASDRPDKTEGPKDYRGLSGYDFKNMPLTYMLDGKEYHCVGFEGYDTDGDGEIDFKPDSWEEMQRYLVNAGMTNTGMYGDMQCFNYSAALLSLALGTANPDLVASIKGETDNPEFGNIDDAGNKARSRDYNQRDCVLMQGDRDMERSIIENELQNGRPCVVSVPYPGGSHYVLATGMADDGSIMIWDSYDGSMQRLGKTSSTDNNSEHRNLATGMGVYVFVNGYRYNNSGHGYGKYFTEVVGQDPESAIKDALARG